MYFSPSDFRLAFIDCQNHAGFNAAARKMVHQFKYALMADASYCDCNCEDSLKLSIAKTKAIIGCILDGRQFTLVLNKNGINNVLNECSQDSWNELTKDVRITETVILHNKENIKLLVSQIAKLYIGENFDYLDNFLNA